MSSFNEEEVKGKRLKKRRFRVYEKMCSIVLCCSCLNLIFAGADFRKKCIIKTEPTEIREV